MARELDVFLHDQLAGHLVQDDDGLINFTYTKDYLNQSESIPLSHSLPFSEVTFPSKVCKGFFAGLLPEGEKREIIAKNLGISARNDFSMLEQIGGECAGAITFLPTGIVLPKEQNLYRILSEKELINVLRQLPTRPLLAGEGEIRLSLAGAQEKLAVFLEHNTMSIPLGNSLSTHIIKPDIARFPGMVHNEALCMRLAQQIGLDAAKVEIRSVDKMDFLLVERYDRKQILPREKSTGTMSHYKRVHQEDFCQALGIVPEKKYQLEGGPSIADCVKLVRAVSSLPVLDIQRLLDAIIFNFLIGNNDAHGKNFSLLYPIDPTHQDRRTALTPLYDLVCTMYYPDLSQQMAMAIVKYKSDRILPEHFESMAEECKLSKSLVKKRVIELALVIQEELPKVKSDHPTSIGVANWISKHVKQVLMQFNS